MVELIRFILDNIVDPSIPIDVRSTKEDGKEEITVLVPENHMGKVIGKQGRIAKALRTVVKAAAIKQNKKVTVEIVS